MVEFGLVDKVTTVPLTYSHLLINKQDRINEQGVKIFPLVPEKNYMGGKKSKYMKKCEQGVGQNLKKH